MSEEKLKYLYQDDDELQNDSKGIGFHQLKADNELFQEDAYIPQTLINVKRVVSKRETKEDWVIYQDKKIALRLKGNRFSLKEKQFLRTVDGMKFIVSEYKSGSKSINAFKNKLKEIL